MRLVPYFIVGSLKPIMLRMPGRRRHDDVMACLRDIQSELADLRRAVQRLPAADEPVHRTRFVSSLEAVDRLARRRAA